MSDLVNVVGEETKDIFQETKKELLIRLYRKGEVPLSKLKEHRKYNLVVGDGTVLVQEYFLDKKEINTVLLSLEPEVTLNGRIQVKEVNEPEVTLITRIKSNKGREIKLNMLDKNTYYHLKFNYPGSSGICKLNMLEFQELFKEIGKLEETFGEGRVKFYVAPIRRKK